MDPHVAVQSVTSATAVRTDRALKRLFFRVDLVVAPEISFLGERHFANAALEWTFA